ncbi:aminopeptidase N [Desulfuromusa kysingii]|uniref:Aminopeptidase N n=1 Tax=Desulfuromusa kysingii TaxID=37625 RepID=A0A1H4EAN9_9BACT|nr:aminopeptidase N [Desulfuromusa kysingii]SEA82006.1 aminopeptidase N [Desulfuromusa kysingii]
MSKNTPETIYLKDYKTPAYLLDQVELDFHLYDSATRVSSVLHLSLNPDRGGVLEPLVLDGEQLQLLEVKLDGNVLATDQYCQSDVSLAIPKVPETFTLEITTEIDPLNNTALEGLYLTSGNFCTQCEAQGFRRITYYPDRPDVLAKFRVRIEADKQYSVLLSNGNLLEQGDLAAGRHYAVWEDPFRKPCYLFALVAGDLVCLEDHYTTASGRDVLLQIYVEERNSNYCDHAMLSLKKSMQWDEETFGLEYDLDRFMIVAVDDFNMGAMENKGLNIFNSKYVLAHPDTATDNDYLGVESVIGHEYFHNWTGNRVTCRDWFQLSLKEGLTVFRDQQFSADMNSAAVKRIDDVRILRQFQFPEDAGPMAHPVRPAAYQEINNFYTTTIYNKGAEVIRMMQTLIGEEKFIAGVQLYLQRHDGSAVTCDDFVKAMEDAGDIDLTTFKRWYSQAGTPQVRIEQSYDAAQQTLTLKISQECAATPGQPQKEPFHIPVAIGFLDATGRDMPLRLRGEAKLAATTRILELTQSVQEFTFVAVDQQPILSPLRGFSAPVRLHCDVSDTDLAFRMAHDSDSFNRWEAGQTLALHELLRMYDDHRQGQSFALQPIFVDAWKEALTDRQVDKSLLTQLLTLPSEQYLADHLQGYDPQIIREVRDQAIIQLAQSAEPLLLQCYQQCFVTDTDYSLAPAQVGQRSFANFCLDMLMALNGQEIQQLCLQQYRSATNMTDRLAAFAALVDSSAAERQAIIDDFYQQWQQHPLLLDKWFSLQALSHRPDTFSVVRDLLQHPAFTLKNPNRVRALLGAFYQNLSAFHRADGAGYQLLIEQIMQLDQRNPQVAARMAAPLTRWKSLESGRRELLKAVLVRLQQLELSRDLYEIINKSLS